MNLSRSDFAFILNDAYRAWSQGADETRRFPPLPHRIPAAPSRGGHPSDSGA